MRSIYRFMVIAALVPTCSLFSSIAHRKQGRYALLRQVRKGPHWTVTQTRGPIQAWERGLLPAEELLADIQEMTPLHTAAFVGDVVLVSMLLRERLYPIDVRSLEGSTPLHYASGKGNRHIVHMLLEVGADPNAVNSKYEATPLHYAAGQGRDDVVCLLLRAGASKDIQNRLGCTPLYCATSNGHIGTVGLLVAAGAYLDALSAPLMVHVRGSNGQLLAQETVHQEQTTAVRYALTEGFFDIAKLLVRFGATITKEDLAVVKSEQLQRSFIALRCQYLNSVKEILRGYGLAQQQVFYISMLLGVCQKG